MKASEANQIIAEYMEAKFREYSELYHYDEYHSLYGREPDEFLYTQSLDALVPVWEKLNYKVIVYYQNIYCSKGLFEVVAHSRHGDLKMSKGVSENSIQEAAAIATAKAIKELGREG